MDLLETRVYPVVEKMSRLTPGKKGRERVLFFQPLFFLWNEAKSLNARGDRSEIERIRVRMQWAMVRLLGGDEYNLVDDLCAMIEAGEFDLLTAVWEMLWSWD